MRKASLAALRVLDTLLVWVATGGFIVMMLAVVGQVFFRYVLETAVPWTEELARLFFVESMLLGMAVAIRRHEHIIVDFLFNKLPPRGRNVVAVIFNIAIILLLVLLMRGSWDLVARGWNARLVSLPWVSVGYIYLGLFISLGLMVFYTALNLAARVSGRDGAVGQRLESDA
jgi:TRAP-type transport system small permease protein